MPTHTKGNVIVENINIGDIHYEFEYGLGIKSEVISKPHRDANGYATWESKNLTTNKVIQYGVDERYSFYGPNLYDYIAYEVKHWI